MVQNSNEESEQAKSRESTPNLLEPLNYEIIQLDDDDDDEEEEEVMENEEHESGEHQQIKEIGDGEIILQMEDQETEKSDVPIIKRVKQELEKGKRKLKTSTNNLVVDISQSIKWHEIINENSETDKNKPKKIKIFNTN